MTARPGDGIDVSALFRPFRAGSLSLANRIVMPPMGVHKAESGVPGPDVAAYYSRRAEGGVGLILTEGVCIDHPVSGNNPGYLRLNSEASIAGWAEVVRQVHAADCPIIPELWHVGLVYLTSQVTSADHEQGAARVRHLARDDRTLGLHHAGRAGRARDDDLSDQGRDRFVRAGGGSLEGDRVRRGRAARRARVPPRQFFWDAMNRRTDGHGGTMANRARFGAEVASAVRSAVGPDYPLLMRISQ